MKSALGLKLLSQRAATIRGPGPLLRVADPVRGALRHSPLQDVAITSSRAERSACPFCMTDKVALVCRQTWPNPSRLGTGSWNKDQAILQLGMPCSMKGAAKALVGNSYWNVQSRFTDHDPAKLQSCSAYTFQASHIALAGRTARHEYPQMYSLVSPCTCGRLESILSNAAASAEQLFAHLASSNCWQACKAIACRYSAVNLITSTPQHCARQSASLSTLTAGRPTKQSPLT